MCTRMSALTVVAFLALTSFALAQGTTGTLSGTLTDSSGAVMPGVTVTLSGPSLQGVRTTVSDEQGFYRFRNVPPGPDYSITATLSGFRDAGQANIRVFLGQEGDHQRDTDAGRRDRSGRGRRRRHRWST